jgi:hypothetical protein
MSHVERVFDPESDLDWAWINRRYGLYGAVDRIHIAFEHEARWPAIWFEQIFPRVWGGLLLGKQIVMNLVTPSSAELAMLFLRAIPGGFEVVLPSLNTHSRRFDAGTADSARTDPRPKSWGAANCAWSHTRWSRALLRGIAGELDAQVRTEFPEPRVERREELEKHVRFVSFGDRGFFEPLPGRWIELDGRGQVLGLFGGRDAERSGAVTLTADESSVRHRAAGGVRPEELSTEMDEQGRSYHGRQWIPTDRLCPPTPGRKNAVLFFAGTFAPFHRGHLGALECARGLLEEQAWNLLGGYVCPVADVRGRSGDCLERISPYAHRAAMVQLGLEGTRWMLDRFGETGASLLDADALLRNQHVLQSIVGRLRARRLVGSEPVTTFWVIGADATFDREFFEAFARHAGVDRSNPLRIVVVDNRGEGGLSDGCWVAGLGAASESLLRVVDRAPRVTAEVRSATRVREALDAADRAKVGESVGIPLVEAYLVGLMQSAAAQGS